MKSFHDFLLEASEPKKKDFDALFTKYHGEKMNSGYIWMYDETPEKKLYVGFHRQASGKLGFYVVDFFYAKKDDWHIIKPFPSNIIHDLLGKFGNTTKISMIAEKQPALDMFGEILPYISKGKHTTDEVAKKIMNSAANKDLDF